MNDRARPRLRPQLTWLFTTAIWLVLSACGGNSQAAVGASPAENVPDVTFTFRRHGKELSRLSLKALAKQSPIEQVETDDPYYLRRKRFRAVELTPVLVHAFGQDEASLKRAFFVLKAKDGYAVPVEGSRLLEGGAYIAFDDLDVPGLEPIGPQKVSPAPAYLIWTRSGQGNLDTHPRPWQLAALEIATFETLYPHTVPTGEPKEGPAMHGFTMFREHCLKCHAINREGGRVGPELNVPQSIVEYRPEPQIRAYIRDPESFRYGAMPAHPSLTDTDLDGLVAYFRAMSTRKHDPDRKVTP